MLSRMRKTYDAAFKAKVAFEAAKGEKTITQIASEFSMELLTRTGSRSRLLRLPAKPFFRGSR